MDSHSLEQTAINLIKRSNNILILPSAPVDGDSVGSALALYLALKKINKSATVVCADPVPEVYTFLPSEKEIKRQVHLNRDFVVTLDCSKSEVDHIRYQVEQDKVNIIITPKKGNFTEKQVSFQHGPAKYDLIIVVDAGDLIQLGPIYDDNPELFYEIPVINIDHHASNPGYGKINLIDVTASSACEIVYKLLLQFPEKLSLLDDNIATLLLAGIITDTGSFQNANTTPQSLEVAAQLVNLGARQQEIIKHVYKTKNLTTLKLWGRVLTKIKYSQKYRLVWSIISQTDFKETESKSEDTGGIMDDLMTNTPGAEVVVLLKEKKPGLVSGSIRTSAPAIRADKIAEIFGGGGHMQAAGFRVQTGDFNETATAIIKKIKSYQSERLHLIEDTIETSEVSVEEAPMNQTERQQWLSDLGEKFLDIEKIAEEKDLPAPTTEPLLPPAETPTMISAPTPAPKVPAPVSVPTPTTPALAPLPTQVTVETPKPVSEPTKSIIVENMLSEKKADDKKATVEDIFKDIMP